MEINQFLQYVKDRFSEVLLPAEVVTKLDFIGKGTFPLHDHVVITKYIYSQ